MMTKSSFLVMVFVAFVSMFGTANGATLFRLPLGSNPGIGSWYDHNSVKGAFKRYDCALNLYYDGHNGTDFSTAMSTPILAGANGSLYQRVDGCPDGSLPTCGSSYGNHVRISHPLDSSVTIYGHMKNGTPVGLQSILCGGQVGLSGNSGQSTGPHLHFELWQNINVGSRIDFFGGDCGGASYWVNQNGGSPTTTCQ